MCCRDTRKDIKMVCVLLHTCDKYEFCWSGWYHLFTKFWKLNWPVYFVNEKKAVDYVGIEQIKTGVGEWSDRLLIALRSLDYEYVFYFQEDAWLRRAVNRGLFEQLYELAFRNKFDALRVIKKYRFMKFEDTDYTVGNVRLCKCSSNSWLLMNHQPSFWKREFFIDCLQPNQDPWKSEAEDTKRLHRIGYESRIYVYPLTGWYDAVSRRGKLVGRAQRVAEKIERGVEFSGW